MGRSSKEACRPPQACDGGGKVYAGNRMDSGQSVKPKSEESSGVKRANARKSAPKESAQDEASRKPGTEDQDMYAGKTGIQQIGQAGADIVGEYKKRNA